MTELEAVDVLAVSQQVQAMYFLTLAVLLVLLLGYAIVSTVKKRRRRD